MRLITFLSLTTCIIVVKAGKYNINDLLIHHEYHGPGAPISKDGRVIDTDEVANAKANHLSIHAETVSELIKLMKEAKKELEIELQKKETQVKESEEPVKVEEKPAEEKVVQEVKPVFEEGQENNEINSEPIVIYNQAYKGPFAPLSEDGLVLDTPEVEKAKTEHLKALENAVKLIQETKSKSNEEEVEEVKKTNEPEAAVENNENNDKTHKVIFLSPLHFIYSHNIPNYQGEAAPLDKDGKVIDTPEVLRAKFLHQQAYEHAKSIAERHPPIEDNNNLV